MTPPDNWFNVENYVTPSPRRHARGVRQHVDHLRRRDRRHDPDRRRHGLRARPLPVRRPQPWCSGCSCWRRSSRASPRRSRRSRSSTGSGLYDSRWALILLFMGTDIISIYIFLQFIRAIPRSLDEAAIIEGAGPPADLLPDHPAQPQARDRDRRHHQGHRDLQRVLPAVPVPAVQGAAPISTTLFDFKGPYGSQWEVISAGVVITIIPILVLFLFLQRYIYNGFTSGATK